MPPVLFSARRACGLPRGHRGRDMIVACLRLDVSARCPRSHGLFTFMMRRTGCIRQTWIDALSSVLRDFRGYVGELTRERFLWPQVEVERCLLKADYLSSSRSDHGGGGSRTRVLEGKTSASTGVSGFWLVAGWEVGQPPAPESAKCVPGKSRTPYQASPGLLQAYQALGTGSLGPELLTQPVQTDRWHLKESCQFQEMALLLQPQPQIHQSNPFHPLIECPAGQSRPCISRSESRFMSRLLMSARLS